MWIFPLRCLNNKGSLLFGTTSPEALRKRENTGPVLEKQLKAKWCLFTSIFSTEELISLVPAEASRILGTCSRAAQHPTQLGTGEELNVCYWMEAVGVSVNGHKYTLHSQFPERSITAPWASCTGLCLREKAPSTSITVWSVPHPKTLNQAKLLWVWGQLSPQGVGRSGASSWQV